VYRNSRLGLLLALLCAGSMWFYVQHVLVPFQKADATAHLRPRGNLSDLYPRWLGARELLLHQRDPYSPEITREIQIGYYGRPLDPARPDDPKDQQGFAYPVYVVFLLAPTITLPFQTVHSVFGALLIVFTCAASLLWLRTLQWRPPAITVIILIVLTIGSFPAIQGFKLQQLSLVVCVLIAASATLILEGQLAMAGVLLALATIKPQLVLLLSLWMLLWACSEWRARRRFVLGFGTTMALLFLGAQLVLPGWIGGFYHALIAYRHYIGGGGSVLDALTTPVIGKFLAALILIWMAGICWSARRASAASPEFAFVTALVLAVTIAVIPMTALYNQLLLLPALYWFAKNRRPARPARPVGAWIIAVCAAIIFWQWFATIALVLASFFWRAESVQRYWSAPLFASLAVPVAVLVLLVPGSAELLRRNTGRKSIAA
jgi:hypothetical protein